MKKPTTIKDVARLAGVSLGTVSRVINRAEDVAPELAERTLAVIRETNYTPQRKSRAKSLKVTTKAHQKTIGMLYCSSTEWRNSQLFTDYTGGIKKACREAKYDLMVFMEDDFAYEEFMGRIDKLDGLLIKFDINDKSVDLAKLNRISEFIPVVGFGMNYPICKFPQVSFDNYLAGSLAAEELIRRGHSRIAFINHSSKHSMFIPRGHGYMEAMKRHGLWDSELFIENNSAALKHQPESEFPDFDEYLEHLLSLRPRVTAVIVANDWGAGGFYQSCRNKGIRIPDDISVMGFDNNNMICQMLDPGLSSISNPFKQISTLATRMLIASIEKKINFGGCCPIMQYLPGVLIERKSILDINKIK